MSFFDEEIRNELKIYLKGRKTLEQAEVDKIIPKLKEFYKDEKSKPIEERIGYMTIDNADYVIFKTDEEAYVDDSGNTKNLPRKVGEKDTWMLWARFPLMTGNDAQYPTRITVFDSSEKPDYFSWKTIVLAKGKIKVQYKGIGEEGYHIPLKKFLKQNNATSLDDIDPSDYTKNYTLNLDQVLEKVQIE